MFASAINVFDGPSPLRLLSHMLLQTIEFCYQNCIYQGLNGCKGGRRAANNVLEKEEKT